MIFHDVSQGSAEWFKMRLGIATASCFDKIVTPKTFEPSKQMEDYAFKLIGELVTLENSEVFTSYWMERGAQLEDDAARSYEAITGHNLINGGFVTNDAMTYGASPDRRVLDSTGNVIGGVEIKCPAPATHIKNILRNGEIDPSYLPQVQGQILIGGFEFVDWFSYHPDMPPALIRVERDDRLCQKLEVALNEFCTMVEEKISSLKKACVFVNERPILSMHEKSNAYLMI